MQLHTLLAAAAETSGTANFPYLMGLLALIISLVAIIQVAGLRRDFSQSATPATARSHLPNRSSSLARWHRLDRVIAKAMKEH